MNDKTTSRRGGRRPGAGRKPNYLKQLGRAVEHIWRRDPRLGVLTELEARCLAAIVRKIRTARLDGPQNQIESNTAIEAMEVAPDA
jgi:hypothetical protein